MRKELIGDFLAQVFGGGSQIAPQYQTYNPATASTDYLGQNFAGEQQVSNNLTSNTSAANLSTFLTGLNGVDSGAVQGINAEQNLGNTLMTGSGSALPSWAKTYMNNAQMTGAENAIGRGVGAFSNNGMSGVNQYVGNNAMNLVNMGASLASGASGQASNLVNSNMYRNDPMSGLLSPGQFMQAGMFNTGILNQQAEANAGVNNWNSNNSPLGNLTRTGLSMIASLAGSFLGDNSLGSSLSMAGNGAGGPIQGSQTSGGGGSGGSGLLGGLGMMALI